MEQFSRFNVVLTSCVLFSVAGSLRKARDSFHRAMDRLRLTSLRLRIRDTKGSRPRAPPRRPGRRGPSRGPASWTGPRRSRRVPRATTVRPPPFRRVPPRRFPNLKTSSPGRGPARNAATRLVRSRPLDRRLSGPLMECKFLLIYPPIAYYWTVPLILDHLYLVGKVTSSEIADTRVSGF